MLKGQLPYEARPQKKMLNFVISDSNILKFGMLI